MESWWRSGKWKPAARKRKAEYPAVDLSEAMRWLELWREGGLYMDLDTVTLRPLHSLIDVAGIQDKGLVNCAILQISKIVSGWRIYSTNGTLV